MQIKIPMRILINRPSVGRSFLRSFTAAATAQKALQARGDITNLSTLKNGFRVASYNNGRPIATVGIWIESGSRYETRETSGVGTLWEHLFYSGTSKRTPKQLHSELAIMGARLNSFTDRERTAYFVQCFPGDVEKALDILSDLMRNTNITDSRLEQYRKIHMQKLEEYESDYKAMVFNNLHFTAFQGNSFGLPSIGMADSISSLTGKDVFDFVDDCYKPIRMVLTGVGNVDHGQLEKLAEKYFGDLENTYKRKIPQKSAIRFSGSEYLFRNDSIPYMYGAVAVEGATRDDIDHWALHVVNTAIGQWDRTHATSLNSPSSLIQKVSPLQELITYEGFYHGYDNTGLFGYYTVCHGRDVIDTGDLFQFFQREWRHFGTGVTDQEVERAKNKLKTNLFLTLEDNAQVANYVASEVLCNGKITSLAELERKISYINANAVRTAVMNFIYDKDIAIAGVGRTEAFPQYYNLRYGMSWWRL